MKKFLGIVKVYNEHMSGVNVIIKTKTYDDITLINEWFDLYPGCEHVVLNNTEELDSMFGIFEDMTPITKEEKEFIEQGRLLRKRLMSDEH